jgi:hypothetical protein
MNKKIKNIAMVFLVIAFFMIPLVSFAQSNSEKPIIPACGQYNECGFQDLIKLVDNIMGWIIMISTPVAAGVFAWAGFLLMTTAVADKKSKAKSMMQKVFIGFFFILAAWVIVKTITFALLSPDFKMPIKLGESVINIHV